jgi:hypothetical protein
MCFSYSRYAAVCSALRLTYFRFTLAHSAYNCHRMRSSTNVCWKPIPPWRHLFPADSNKSALNTLCLPSTPWQTKGYRLRHRLRNWGCGWSTRVPKWWSEPASTTNVLAGHPPMPCTWRCRRQWAVFCTQSPPWPSCPSWQRVLKDTHCLPSMHPTCQ